MLFATMFASSSGRFTSKMFIWTSFFVIFLSSSFSLSTSCPPLPIIIPGRAVLTVTVISFSVLSIIIFERLAFASLAFRYSLILVSSTSLPEKSFPPYQFESHPLIIPNLLPIGFTFCPICSNLMFFQLRLSYCLARELRGLIFFLPCKLFPEVLSEVFSERVLRQHEQVSHRGCCLRLSHLHFLPASWQ